MLWMVDDLFSAGLSTKTSSTTSCGKLVENNDTFMGLVDHAGPSPLFSRFIPSISCRSESSNKSLVVLDKEWSSSGVTRRIQNKLDHH